jgi:glutamate/tyrosine decarboxylase-like PLP-dependent enzyme
LLSKTERESLWCALEDAVETYVDTVGDLRVTPVLDLQAIRDDLARVDFDRPLDPGAAVRLAVEGLRAHQVHTPHPRYFGLFNPAPTTMGIAADTLVAAFNPQLAAFTHSPWAVEVEALLIRALGERLGYDPSAVEGTFASGGAEANHTAVLAALARAFPDVAARGLRALSGPPTLYVSAESHHSFLKAARMCGLGTDSVRTIPVDRGLAMDVDALRRAVSEDAANGCLPFLVVGTAGTTAAGVFDPLPATAETAREFDLWFHVDAAWGGGIALVPELRRRLQGTEASDSITFDAHKMLSVPMGAGVFITRHRGQLGRTFRVAAGYMPREGAGLPVSDPYAVSMQWSRRFIGLKLFLSLCTAGWDGYAEALRHQIRMGDVLREMLVAAGWTVVNKTPLPLVCFRDAGSGRAPRFLEAVLGRVLARGEAWISLADLPHHGPVLRACITNYRTGRDDLVRLVDALNEARTHAETHPLP